MIVHGPEPYLQLQINGMMTGIVSIVLIKGDYDGKLFHRLNHIFLTGAYGLSFMNFGFIPSLA